MFNRGIISAFSHITRFKVSDEYLSNEGNLKNYEIIQFPKSRLYLASAMNVGSIRLFLRVTRDANNIN